MRSLIYQYYLGTDIPDWAKISSSLFQNYANEIGSEYEFGCPKEYSSHPYFGWLDLIYNTKYEKYDQILFIDNDVIPEKNESIFDNTHDDDIDLWAIAERQYPNMTATPGGVLSSTQNQYMKELNNRKLKPWRIEENKFIPILNSGVMIWSANGRLKAREKFISHETWYNTHYGQMKLDQPFLNIQLNEFNVKELELKWNCYPRVRWKEDHFPKDAVFLHYTNKKKTQILELYGDKNEN